MTTSASCRGLFELTQPVWLSFGYGQRRSAGAEHVPGTGISAVGTSGQLKVVASSPPPSRGSPLTPPALEPEPLGAPEPVPVPLALPEEVAPLLVPRLPLVPLPLTEP